ncbi:transcription factor SPEECHLESS-like [Cornus florida]|uniref:transcription factor SPEECHLESS-like n=1 Tax=Cornus florida TaxID=4283 RepID=UPI0028973A97|nr:transcription factor SPEECHLESS-like [Cornus florida]
MGGDSSTNLSHLFVQSDFGETDLAGAASPDDLFSIFEALDGGFPEFSPVTRLEETVMGSKEGEKSSSSSAFQEFEAELDALPKCKRQKFTATTSSVEAQPKVSHITVERNRRKQMNDNLSVLKSLMPCFYVKRGDQASIIEGVVDYINELQQVLQSLEAKKQRRVYSEVLSPRLNVSSSPRPSTPVPSPRMPPLSPRLNLPISPRTPQPSSPYKPRLHQGYQLSPTMITTTAVLEASPSSSTSSIDHNANELIANSKSAIADVEVKFSGPNLLLKTVSSRIPGQVVKMISALEDLSLEVLHVSVKTMDETMLSSFTIKIGVECQLSAEDLAHQIQQTFCQVY